MQININQIPVCVINLPERKERLQRTINELTKFYGKEPDNLFIINGVKDRLPMKGIAQSHINCIKLAKEKSWPFVVIVEDDVFFQSVDSKIHADLCFSDTPDDFDILLGGIYTSAGLVSYNEYWNKTRLFSATHYYVVNSKVYDKILSFNKTEHIDRWYAGTAKLNCYVAKKFFAIQHVGFSDNKGYVMNYNYLLKRFDVLK